MVSKMKVFLNVLFTALVLHTAEACKNALCSAFCAGEIKDPSKKLTFYSETALSSFNEKFEGNEKFVFVHKGKCTYDKKCSDYAESQICAIPEPGANGFPRTFKNFCELNKFNCDNPNNEYLYYHDDSCNDLKDPTPSKAECECLDCTKAYWKPVCAYSSGPELAQPVTFSSYCWIKKFNCAIPDARFLYWHENICYTDPINN